MPFEPLTPPGRIPSPRTQSPVSGPIPALAQPVLRLFDTGDDFQTGDKPEPPRPRGLPDNAYWHAHDGCWRVRSGKMKDWYLLPGFDPEQPDLHDGNWQPRRRVTTFIKNAEISNDQGIMDWKIRHVVTGLLMNPELLGMAWPLAARMVDKQDTDPETYKEQNAEWRKLIEEAHEFTGGNRGSKNGSVVHYVTEMLDRGAWTLDDVPERWRKHAASYVALRDGEPGFTVDPQYVERVIDPNEVLAGIDGSPDRYVWFTAPDSLIDDLNQMRLRHGLDPLPYEREPRFTVLDVKTGDIAYSLGKFGRQMLVYAHGRAVWNYEQNYYEPLPDVNKDYGLVVAIKWWDENPVAELIVVPYLGAAGEPGLNACTYVQELGRPVALPAIASAAAPGDEPAQQEDPVARYTRKIDEASSVDQLQQLRAAAKAEGIDWTSLLFPAAKAKAQQLRAAS